MPAEFRFSTAPSTLRPSPEQLCQMNYRLVADMEDESYAGRCSIVAGGVSGTSFPVFTLVPPALNAEATGKVDEFIASGGAAARAGAQ